MAHSPKQSSPGDGSLQTRAVFPDKLQYRQLLDHLPAGAYTCDADGLITYFNQSAVQLWGRAPKLNDPTDRLCGSFKLFSADGTPIAHDECWMALALKNRRAYNSEEIVVERPDGSRFTVLAHANPVFDDDSGKLLGAINVLVDISDRKRAEEVQALLAAIVESSEDAIVSKTLDGRITSWNVGAQRLFGYPAEEAIGRSITLIIPPERLDEERGILEALRRGERIEHFETARVDKDGRQIDISLTISPVRDASGRIIGASKVARDISIRRQSAEALLAVKDELATQLTDLRRLHEMSTRLATTLELQPILDETLRTAVTIEGTDRGLITLCGGEQNALQVSASLGFGDEFLEQAGALPPGGGACGMAFQERRRVVIEDVETDPAFAPYREMARRAGFRAVHSTPLLTRSGKVVGVLSTHYRRPHRPSDRETHLIDLCARQAVDFMENARLYTELLEADRRKDEFLATLAHELRNPLAPISNSLQLLRLSDDLSPTVERIREILDRQVAHLVRLVDDLMEVSRVTRGKIELRKEHVELATVIATAVETSRPAIDAAAHQLAISAPTEPIGLEADPMRLAQVISNLLNNAAKYTEQGGQIWLTARRDGAEAVISVKDTGVGIPVEMLPQVFDMFSQVDRSLSRAQGGLGIGLALAKSLIEMHGGRVEVHSAGAGQGTEFVVRLPLLARALHSPADTISSKNCAAQTPSRKVLLVDDQRDAIFILTRMLTAMGHEVLSANSAAQALEVVNTQRPELIISDIAMPHMNGYELAERLRQHPGLEDVMLVALTGYSQDSDRQKAKNAGFDHHLVKPVGLEALQNVLAALPPPKSVLSGSGL